MAPNTSIVNDANISGSKIVVRFNPVTQLPIKLASSPNFSLCKVQVSMIMSRRTSLVMLMDRSQSLQKISLETTWKYQILLMFHGFNKINLYKMLSLKLWMRPLAVFSLLLQMPKSCGMRCILLTKINLKLVPFCLRYLLALLSKDCRPVADYIHQVFSLCDKISIPCSSVSNEELVFNILTGLGSAFQEISTAIDTRD